MGHLADVAANNKNNKISINGGNQAINSSGKVVNTPQPKKDDQPVTTAKETKTADNGMTLVNNATKSPKTSTNTGYTTVSNDSESLSDYYKLANLYASQQAQAIADAQSQYESQIAAYKAEQEKLAQEQAAAKQKALQDAVTKTTNNLNAQKDTTSQEYADIYRQLYLNNMNSQKNINQQLAAQGLTGGASESTLLGLNTNYEDNLRQGKVSEQNALKELDQAITDAQLSGDIESANALYDIAAQKANAYSNAYQNYLSAYQNSLNNTYNTNSDIYGTLSNALANQQSQSASQASETKSYNYQIAMAMLQSGSMPSDTLLNSAGISKADAQTIVAQYVANKASNGSGSGNSGAQATLGNSAGYKADGTIDYITVKGYGRLTVDEVEKMLANGQITKSVSNGVVTYSKA